MNKRSIWVFGAVFLASSMIYFDQTFIPQALLTIKRFFFLSDLEMQWVINIYRLTIAVFVLPMGRLSDWIGLKKVFISGMIIFFLSSLSCAIAYSKEMLIVARAFQGLGSACIIPTLSPMLFSSFLPHKRGVVVGWKVALSSLLMALGPFLGGIITEKLSWRLVFCINPLLAILGLLMGYFAFKEVLKEKQNLEGRNFIYLSLSAAFLTFFIMEVKSFGWASFFVSGSFFLFLFFLFLFLFLEKKEESNRKLFFDRSFKLYSLNILFVEFALSITIFWPIFLQKVLFFSPSLSGKISTLSYLPVIIAAPIAGKMVDRVGAKIPLIVGYLLTILSFILAIFFISYGSFGFFIALILLGFGGIFAQTPAFIGALNTVDASKRGRASGVLNMVRSTGTMLGVAVMGALLIWLEPSNSLSPKNLKKEIILEAKTENVKVSLEKANEKEVLKANQVKAMQVTMSFSVALIIFLYLIIRGLLPNNKPLIN